MIIPVIDMIATGKNIQLLRESSGLSVRQLQGVFGFATPQAIYKWQHGDSLPTLDNMLVLSEIFEVPVEKIVVTRRVSA